MPDAESMYTLIERGGVIAVLLLGLIGIALGFIGGLIVPGWLYKEKRTSEERAIELAKSVVESVKELAAEVRELRNEAMRRTRQ